MLFQPLAILNINTDETALYHSSRILRGAGFRVFESNSIAEALLLVRQRPDLIVIEAGLGKEGQCSDICQAAYSPPSGKPIPVLRLIPGLNGDVDEFVCPIGKRCNCLPWPGTPNALLAAIRRLAPNGCKGSGELLEQLTLAASYQVDPEGIVVEWSGAAEQLFGWQAHEVLGLFLPIVDAARREEFLSMLSHVCQGQPIYRWETIRRTRSGKLLFLAISMQPILNASATVERIQIIAADVSESQRLQEELQRLSSIILASEDFVCIFSEDGLVEFLNPAGCRLLGINFPLNIGTRLNQLLPDAVAERVLTVAAPRAKAEFVFLDELELVDATGAEMPVSVQIVRLGPTASVRFAMVARDIREQKESERKLLSLNRIHQVLLKCSQAIQQEDDEKSLFSSICNLLTDLGGYRFVLVSLLFPNPDEKLQPTAWSGDDSVTASDLLTSWDADHECGGGAVGLAVRTGQAVILNDLDATSECASWQQIIQRLSLRSVIALPLVDGPKIFGVLSIHSAQADIFSLDERRLLQDLGRQLAHAIHALRADAERRKAENMLRLFSGAIDATLDGVMLTDAQRPDHPIVYVNPAFSRITGWEANEVLGKSGRILAAGDLLQPEMEVIRHALRGRVAGHAVLRCFRKDGEFFWNELHVAPIFNDEQNVSHYVSVISDISERIRHEDQLAHLATHDSLTGLANRTLLGDRLQQAIVRAQRDGRLVALLLINLDRFKQINETQGHGTGDMLLHMIALRLKGLSRESDTLARIGGDEFVLLLTDLVDEQLVSSTGRMLLEQMALPFIVDGENVVITPSIGASIYPHDASSAENLMCLADVAMHVAKESGCNTFSRFSQQMSHRSQHQIAFEKDLRFALERNQLVLYYQPKVDLYSGAITGAEALIRWQHPERGLVPPVQFIPLAEASGLIVPIGSWVLQEACRQTRQWQLAGLPPFRVAVNLSPLQFRQPDLVEQIENVLTETGLSPEYLELEVTESLVMDNPEAAADFLKRLKKMGIRLAMDDFGTGYSSLGYLRRFPFDVLKIDKSFVQNIISEPDDALIATTVIVMAHSLGLQVIAEGVEDESQMRYLRTHLCDEMQGYLFSRPLPVDEMAALLRNPPDLLRIASGQDRQERTLLLVDDEPDILNSLKRLLRRSGYRILTANSAAEGLEQLALHNVQVVVSDQRMPVMSGSEFLGRVKVLYPETMRIVLSGYTELAALTDAINRGAIYKFVTKPWDDEELREVIREAFVTYGHRASQLPVINVDGGGI